MFPYEYLHERFGRHVANTLLYGWIGCILLACVLGLLDVAGAF